jgi:hypothetical protein
LFLYSLKFTLKDSIFYDKCICFHFNSLISINYSIESFFIRDSIIGNFFKEKITSHHFMNLAWNDDFSPWSMMLAFKCLDQWISSCKILTSTKDTANKYNTNFTDSKSKCIIHLTNTLF